MVLCQINSTTTLDNMSVERRMCGHFRSSIYAPFSTCPMPCPFRPMSFVRSSALLNRLRIAKIIFVNLQTIRSKPMSKVTQGTPKPVQSLQNKIPKAVHQAVRKWNIIANIKKRIEKLIRLYAELAGGLRWKKQTYNSPSIDDSNTEKCREKKKTVDKLNAATSLPSFIQEPDLNQPNADDKQRLKSPMNVQEKGACFPYEKSCTVVSNKRFLGDVTGELQHIKEQQKSSQMT